MPPALRNHHKEDDVVQQQKRSAASLLFSGFLTIAADALGLSYGPFGASASGCAEGVRGGLYGVSGILPVRSTHNISSYVGGDPANSSSSNHGNRLPLLLQRIAASLPNGLLAIERPPGFHSPYWRQEEEEEKENEDDVPLIVGEADLRLLFTPPLFPLLLRPPSRSTEGLSPAAPLYLHASSRESAQKLPPAFVSASSSSASPPTIFSTLLLVGRESEDALVGAEGGPLGDEGSRPAGAAVSEAIGRRHLSPQAADLLWPSSSSLPQSQPLASSSPNDDATYYYNSSQPKSFPNLTVFTRLLPIVGSGSSNDGVGSSRSAYYTDWPVLLATVRGLQRHQQVFKDDEEESVLRTASLSLSPSRTLSLSPDGAIGDGTNTTPNASSSPDQPQHTSQRITTVQSLLSPNGSSQACVIDHAAEGAARCVFFIPKGATRFELKAAQTDFAEKTMKVEVFLRGGGGGGSSLALGLGSGVDGNIFWEDSDREDAEEAVASSEPDFVDYCGGGGTSGGETEGPTGSGTSPTHKFLSEKGQRGRCGTFLTCSRRFLYSTDEEADSNDRGIVVVTLPAGMRSYYATNSVLFAGSTSTNGAADSETTTSSSSSTNINTNNDCGYTAAVIAEFSRPNQPPVSCDRATAFECPSERRCVPLSYVCDGIQDCANDADERPCLGLSRIPDEAFCIDSSLYKTIHNFSTPTSTSLVASFVSSPSSSSSSSSPSIEDCLRMAVAAGSYLFTIYGPLCEVINTTAVGTVLLAAPETYLCRIAGATTFMTLSSSSSSLSGSGGESSVGDSSGTFSFGSVAPPIAMFQTCRASVHCSGRGVIVGATTTTGTDGTDVDADAQSDADDVESGEGGGGGSGGSSCVCRCFEGYFGNDCSRSLSVEDIAAANVYMDASAAFVYSFATESDEGNVAPELRSQESKLEWGISADSNHDEAFGSSGRYFSAIREVIANPADVATVLHMGNPFVEIYCGEGMSSSFSSSSSLGVGGGGPSVIEYVESSLLAAAYGADFYVFNTSRFANGPSSSSPPSHYPHLRVGCTIVSTRGRSGDAFAHYRRLLDPQVWRDLRQQQQQQKDLVAATASFPMPLAYISARSTLAPLAEVSSHQQCSLVPVRGGGGGDFPPPLNSSSSSDSSSFDASGGGLEKKDGNSTSTNTSSASASVTLCVDLSAPAWAASSITLAVANRLAARRATVAVFVQTGSSVEGGEDDAVGHNATALQQQNSSNSLGNNSSSAGGDAAVAADGDEGSGSYAFAGSFTCDFAASDGPSGCVISSCVVRISPAEELATRAAALQTTLSNVNATMRPDFSSSFATASNSTQPMLSFAITAMNFYPPTPFTFGCEGLEGEELLLMTEQQQRTHTTATTSGARRMEASSSNGGSVSSSRRREEVAKNSKRGFSTAATRSDVTASALPLTSANDGGGLLSAALRVYQQHAYGNVPIATDLSVLNIEADYANLLISAIILFAAGMAIAAAAAAACGVAFCLRRRRFERIYYALLEERKKSKEEEPAETKTAEDDATPTRQLLLAVGGSTSQQRLAVGGDTFSSRGSECDEEDAVADGEVCAVNSEGKEGRKFNKTKEKDVKDSCSSSSTPQKASNSKKSLRHQLRVYLAVYTSYAVGGGAVPNAKKNTNNAEVREEASGTLWAAEGDAEDGDADAVRTGGDGEATVRTKEQQRNTSSAFSSRSSRTCASCCCPRLLPRPDRACAAFALLGASFGVVAAFLVIFYETSFEQTSNFKVLYEEYSDPLCERSLPGFMPRRLFAVEPSEASRMSCERVESIGESVGATYAAGSCVEEDYTTTATTTTPTATDKDVEGQDYTTTTTDEDTDTTTATSTTPTTTVRDMESLRALA